jgi:hypothetical protein
MSSVTRELIIIGIVAVAVALGVGAWMSQYDRSDEPRIGLPPEAVIDGSTVTPAAGGSLRIVTATVPVTRESVAPISTAVPPTQPPVIIAEATIVVTQAPEATQAPAATQIVPAAVSGDFSGRWRIVDTITSGSGAGQTFTFDVSLQQTGNTISGGNAGIQINGSVSGQTATVTYTQPALGHTGTFSWTLVSAARAEGTFTSSVPNAGISILQRLP